MGESEEATPLRRKWAIPAATCAVLIVVVCLYFGSGYVLLSDDSVRGVIGVCMTLIGCAMVAEFTMRSRHRIVVAFVGGICLFPLLGFYVISYNPRFTTVSYWLGVADTIVFFLIFALHALKGKLPKLEHVVPNEAPTRPVKVLENFEARILEKKTSYDKGDPVLFWAKFAGELKNGGFTAKVEAPDGTTDWWADKLMKRALNGGGLHERRWDHGIPQNYPLGQSKVAIQVYGVATETPPDPIEDAFVVGTSESGVKTGGSEQVDLRKKEIWNAFQKWTHLPIVRFRDQQDTLPLAEKPPDLAFEIEECLKHNYPAIWDDLQKLRQQYHGWKNENVSDRFIKVENGQTVIDYRYVLAYNESMCNKLMWLHGQLGKQISSEILDKHHTRLRC